VIDPGHGGKDQGARGRGGLLEKDVTLDIALKLKELIENDPGMKVILTRSGDYFVSLKERTAIANHAKGSAPADLFISIHTNSHKSPKVGGFEAYYISDAIDPSAEATAAMENAVVALEWDTGGPVESALTPILWDLQFTESISESSELAFIAKEELGERLNTRNRGVRQAQFIVLAGVAMPSILVEVGFISNRIEEAKLKTADYKNKCAEALAASVAAFKERYETRLGLLNRKSSP
jgi:N-acetylmuramoyl-L-alanine amidase